MSDLSIERGVPMPPVVSTGKQKQPRVPRELASVMADMGVGDSVLVPLMKGTTSELAAAILDIARLHHRPWIFTTRQLEGGVRFWREA